MTAPGNNGNLPAAAAMMDDPKAGRAAICKLFMLQIEPWTAVIGFLLDTNHFSFRDHDIVNTFYNQQKNRGKWDGLSEKVLQK